MADRGVLSRENPNAAIAFGEYAVGDGNIFDDGFAVESDPYARRMGT
jgi:hypothetical protein